MRRSSTAYPDWQNVVAKRIRQARIDAGLTPIELAWLIGRDVRVVYNYENARSLPSLSVLMDIGDVTKRSLDWLMGRKGAKNIQWP